MAVFKGLPIEIWNLITKYIYLRVDNWCLKRTCLFFNNLILHPKYLKFTKCLAYELIKTDDIYRYLWILKKCNINVNYTDHTQSMNKYQDIYLNDKIKGYDAFVEFSFNNNYQITVLLTNNSKFGRYLLHKGVLK